MNKHIYLNRKRQIAFYSGYASEIQIHAVSKMGVGLPEPPCRRRFQTTVCCCSTMGMVVSNTGKGFTRWSQVSDVETNKDEPLITCRKHKDAIKTGRESLARDESGRYDFLMEYVKCSNEDFLHSEANLFTVQAVAGMEAAPTHHRLRYGTWEPAFRCEGRNPSERITRIRIPMRGAGTEQPVVVMNPRNGGGAKGLCYPAPNMDQPRGRNP